MSKADKNKKQIRNVSTDIPVKKKNGNLIPVEGVVTDALPNMFFTVKVNNEYNIYAYLAGKLNQRFIKVLVGDRVKVEVTPYNLTMGRIIFRYNN